MSDQAKPDRIHPPLSAEALAEVDRFIFPAINKLREVFGSDAEDKGCERELKLVLNSAHAVPSLANEVRRARKQHAPTPASSVLVGEGAENPVRVVLEVLEDWLEGSEEADFDENDVAHLFGMLGTAGYSIVPNAALSAVASTGGGASDVDEQLSRGDKVIARDLCYALRDLGLPADGLTDSKARKLILNALSISKIPFAFAELAAAAPQHLVVEEAAAAFPHLVPVTSFSQVQNGDSLLIVGNIDGVQQHLFHNITTKESAADGQEIILEKKGNKFFNFGMYLEKQSWVKQCYKLQAPAADGN